MGHEDVRGPWRIGRPTEHLRIWMQKELERLDFVRSVAEIPKFPLRTRCVKIPLEDPNTPTIAGGKMV